MYFLGKSFKNAKNIDDSDHITNKQLTPPKYFFYKGKHHMAQVQKVVRFNQFYCQIFSSHLPEHACNTCC